MGCLHALWDMLDGIFACVIVDERSGEFFAARDAIGVCPLYWGRAADGGFWFSSELKGLQAQCESFDIFPPVRALALWTAWHLYQENLYQEPMTVGFFRGIGIKPILTQVLTLLAHELGCQLALI